QGSEGEENAESDPREGEQKDGVDRGEGDNEVDEVTGDVEREIAVEESRLLQQRLGDVGAGVDNGIDGGDRIAGAEDRGSELGGGVVEGVDEEVVVEPEVE